MNESKDIVNLGLIFRLAGVLLLLAGLAGLFIAPMEIQVYSQFEEGGRHAYEGFGFGSLMFANITVQIAGYYFIALTCIPLGYGHLRLRRWVRPAGETLLTDWLVLGLPLTLIAFLMLLTAKDIPSSALPLLIAIFLLLYPLLPGGLLLFYRSDGVRTLFEQDGSGPAALEEKPLAHLVLGSLLAFFALFLHLPLLFNGAFPLFGRYLFDLNGLLATQIAIAALIVVCWGVFRGRPWAWWAAVLYLILMMLTATITFLVTTPADLFSGMHLAEMERQILDNVPLQSYQLLLLFVPPLLVTLALLVTWRRTFGLGGKERRPRQVESEIA
ncbi:MAG: hypothetical protein PVH18_09485 [Chloroflexota bacterium]|jgi:hypothetical protein